MSLSRVLVRAAIIVSVLGLATASLAQDRVDRRQNRQQARIAAGVASGQLNPREAARLERQQGRIQRAENRAEADGVVTAGESRRLERRQNAASANIARQRHDRQ